MLVNELVESNNEKFMVSSLEIFYPRVNLNGEQTNECK